MNLFSGVWRELQHIMTDKTEIYIGKLLRQWLLTSTEQNIVACT